MEEARLEQAILKTLIYFDLFDFPLTAWEVWQWLDWPTVALNEKVGFGKVSLGKVSFGAVKNSLKSLETRVASARGFYFLPGREANVASRLERYLLAERKFRKFRRAAKVLAALPFIRSVAVCNTLAYSNSRDQGDMDVFIIAQSGRIWTARFLGTSLMQLFGLRPRPGQEQDKICLSFWVTDRALDLKPLAIEQDVYLRYWLNQLVPVYMENKYFIKFLQSNLWLRQQLPNFLVYRANSRRRVRLGPFTKRVKRWLEGVLGSWKGEWLEGRLKNLQLKMMPAGLKKMANKSSAVVINDQVLKFHDQDRRAYFRGQYLEKLRKLGI